MDNFDNQKFYIEEKLRSHYRREKEYKRFENNLSRLLRHKAEIQSDIDASNITLNVFVPSIDYSRDRVQVSGTTSPQEREIDKAFIKLERALEKVNNEILETKDEMRCIESDISDVGFIISGLGQEAKDFLDLRYKHLKSNTFIANKMHLSESSIRRLRERTMGELAKWL